MTTFKITIRFFNAPTEQYTVHDYKIENGYLFLVYNNLEIAGFSPTYWAYFTVEVK